MPPNPGSQADRAGSGGRRVALDQNLERYGISLSGQLGQIAANA
jgi:hypothetical protein